MDIQIEIGEPNSSFPDVRGGESFDVGGGGTKGSEAKEAFLPGHSIEDVVEGSNNHFVRGFFCFLFVVI